MTLQSDFNFRMESTSWKSQDLIYDEANRSLSIYLERSGVPQFDWLASMRDFQRWTAPAGEAISADDRQALLDRLASWTAERQIRIDISQPMSVEEMHADLERRKQANKQRQNGAASASSTAKGTLMKRILLRLIHGKQ